MSFQEKKLVWGYMWKVGKVISKKYALELLGSSQMSQDPYLVTGHSVKPNTMMWLPQTEMLGMGIENNKLTDFISFDSSQISCVFITSFKM